MRRRDCGPNFFIRFARLIDVSGKGMSTVVCDLGRRRGDSPRANRLPRTKCRRSVAQHGFLRITQRGRPPLGPVVAAAD